MLRPRFEESFSPRRGHRRSYEGGRRPDIPPPGLHQVYVALPFILRPTDSSVSTHVRWTGVFTAMYLGQILYVVNSLGQTNSRAFGRTNQKIICKFLDLQIHLEAIWKIHVVKGAAKKIQNWSWEKTGNYHICVFIRHVRVRIIVHPTILSPRPSFS